jgi:hypothetical protein
MIQYSRAVAIEPRGRGVLDTRLRGYDDRMLGMRRAQPAVAQIF